MNLAVRAAIDVGKGRVLDSTGPHPGTWRDERRRSWSARERSFADGAAVEQIAELAADPLIKGFTTNPTLMRQAGVADYGAFVKELTMQITDKPISFEVISDDFPEMERQALSLRDLGENVYVKIPITDTSGTSATPLMARLAAAGVSVNATALLTLEQVCAAADALGNGPPAVISVFAGRIADAGIDPAPLMSAAQADHRDAR